MRIHKIIILQLFICFTALDICSAECVSIGAIRWDAWGGSTNGGSVEKYVESTLNPSEYRNRAPVCSEIDNNKLKFNCVVPDVINKEIEYAEIACIDYWAFVTYPQNSSLNNALKLFINSKKSKLKFSLILTPASLSIPQGSLDTNIEKFANYATDQRYMMVLAGRPLFYFLPEGDLLQDNNKLTWLKSSINKLRQQVKIKTKREPYIVAMVNNFKIGEILINNYGFDAISSYAIHGDGQGAPYKQLENEASWFWNKSKELNLPIIPTVMAGWDRRPRVLNRAPWERQNRSNEISFYYNRATADEFANHVGDAVNWVLKNKHVAISNSILIYAWNEYDEGGWIAPTLGEGNARLSALRKKIRNFCPSK